MKLREFGEYKEFDNEKIDGFKKYIEEAWNKRYCLYDDNEFDSYKYINRQQFLIFDGNKIKAKNYVGFISYEDEEVTIYPKVFEENIDKDILDEYLITNCNNTFSYSADKILFVSSLNFSSHKSFVFK